LKGYPAWFSPKLIALIFGLLLLTGTFLIPSTFLRIEFEVPYRLGGNYRISVTALHTFLGFIVIAIVGALSALHMRQGWNKKSERRTGLGLTILISLLVLTGLAIYYLGDESASIVASFMHLAIGLLLPLIYIWHVFVLRPRKRK
jgi:heme A synthase